MSEEKKEAVQNIRFRYSKPINVLTEEEREARLFEMFKNFFELYKNESLRGRHYLLTPADIPLFDLNEKIDIENRKYAESSSEGLRNIAELVYFAATGRWKHNNYGIKIDGYPWIPQKIWPLLDMMILKKDLIFSEVEKKIKELEDEEKENADSPDEDSECDSLKNILKEAGCRIEYINQENKGSRSSFDIGDMLVFAPAGKKIFGYGKKNGDEIRIGTSTTQISMNYPLKEYNYKIIQVGYEEWVQLKKIEPVSNNTGELRDAEQFLEQVIEFAKLNEKSLGINDVAGWANSWNINKEKTLVEMMPENKKGIALFEKNGFIDKRGSEKIVSVWQMSSRYSDTQSFVKNMEELQKELKGKKILSVLDESGDWYLMVFPSPKKVKKRTVKIVIGGKVIDV